MLCWQGSFFFNASLMLLVLSSCCSLTNNLWNTCASLAQIKSVYLEPAAFWPYFFNNSFTRWSIVEGGQCRAVPCALMVSCLTSEESLLLSWVSPTFMWRSLCNTPSPPHCSPFTIAHSALFPTIPGLFPYPIPHLLQYTYPDPSSSFSNSFKDCVASPFPFSCIPPPTLPPFPLQNSRAQAANLVHEFSYAPFGFASNCLPSFPLFSACLTSSSLVLSP